MGGPRARRMGLQGLATLAIVGLSQAAADLADVSCPLVDVSNASFADCEGKYLLADTSVSWAEHRPVYKHLAKDRFIFWNAGGLGWCIGKAAYLTSGSHWHRSNLNTVEPWQGPWQGGVKVTCATSSNSTGCVWSGWAEWAECSASCNSGTQVRRRKELQGEVGCAAGEEEQRECGAGECPRDCRWGSWGTWDPCSLTCGKGRQKRFREVVEGASKGGSACPGQAEEERACATNQCPGSDEPDLREREPDSVGSSCCSKVLVGSTGQARVDQALYMGIYARHSTDYNGSPVYRREGRETLYIYFFTSARDNLSLWVIGPSIGQFIAGIRNSQEGNCVHELGSGWRYASRAGLWEDNDPSLSVTCYRDPLNGIGTFESRRKQPRVDPKKRIGERLDPSAKKEETDEEEIEEVATTLRPRKTRQDCVWSKYGLWSECSKTCGRGRQIRVRRVLQRAKGGGRQCRGGNRERRPCNDVPCTTTTTTTTSTTTRSTTTTRRPIPTTFPTRRPRPTTFAPRRQSPTTFPPQRPRPTTLPTRRPTTRRPTTRRPTTRRPTTRRPTTTTTAVQIRDPNARVECYVCGSLFSTDAPDCPRFDRDDPGQRKLCEVGEACLYYSWQNSGSDSSVIRECFPTSILLGSITSPVQPRPTCTPEPVESDSIQACICTEDLCSGIGNDGDSGSSFSATQREVDAFSQFYEDEEDAVFEFDEVEDLDENLFQTRFSSTTVPPQRLPEPARRTSITERPSSRRVEDRPTSENRVGSSQQDRRTKVEPTRSDPSRVRCHQCGSLFGGPVSNPECTDFDPSDPKQDDYCQQGEACLWYSWEQSATEIAHIRECFNTAILLGSIDDPLLPRPSCQPQDISESGESRITACLCDSDLCNANNGGPTEFVEGNRREVQRLEPQRFQDRHEEPIREIQRNEIQRNNIQENDFQRNEIQRKEIERKESPQDDFRRNEIQRNDIRQNEITRQEPPRREPVREEVEPARQVPPPSNRRSPDKTAGLQCFSCGSLLNPDAVCDKFDPTDPSQVQTCGSGEACMMYSWSKSDTETATLRECFPTSVLLGSIQNPLLAADDCVQRDITDDGSGTILACLCTRDFCNAESSKLGGQIGDPVGRQPERRVTTTRAPERRVTRKPAQTFTRAPETFTRAPQTVTRAPQIVTRAPPKASNSLLREVSHSRCPDGFELSKGQCFFISSDRVGWIEARKMCEAKSAVLVSLLTPERQSELEVLVGRMVRRRRSEFWISGNDIDDEGRWEWAKTGHVEVGAWGWVEEPYNSPEENCLAWSVLATSSFSSSSFWHGSSCCNNLLYICQLI